MDTDKTNYTRLMSMRQYYAGKAMAALIPLWNEAGVPLAADKVAEQAVLYADCLLEELEKEKKRKLELKINAPGEKK